MYICLSCARREYPDVFPPPAPWQQGELGVAQPKPHSLRSYRDGQTPYAYVPLDREVPT